MLGCTLTLARTRSDVAKGYPGAFNNEILAALDAFIRKNMAHIDADVPEAARWALQVRRLVCMPPVGVPPYTLTDRARARARNIQNLATVRRRAGA